MVRMVLVPMLVLVAGSSAFAGQVTPAPAPPVLLTPMPDLLQAEPPQPPRPTSRPAPGTPPATQAPAPAPKPPAETALQARRPRGQNVNLQLEITISDQIGAEAPQKKVVSMLVADASMGRIRASADAQRANLGFVGTGLNVDARPIIMEGDRILLELTVEYTPFREAAEVTQRPTHLNESLSVILQNGKPVVVSQAADPVSDRKMTLEVRASIVR